MERRWSGAVKAAAGVNNRQVLDSMDPQRRATGTYDAQMIMSVRRFVKRVR
jgi:hypothetical protein